MDKWTIWTRRKLIKQFKVKKEDTKMKNMNLLHTNYGNVLDTSCVKSRIFSFHSRFTLVAISLCALLLLGGFTTSVWGATVTFNDGSFSKKQGGITFSLQNSGTDYFQVETNWKGAFKYYWIEKSNDKTSYLPKISWSGIPEGYTISVTKLNFHADAYLSSTAKGYLASPYHTSPDVKFYDATGGQDIEVTSTTYPSLFPTGSNSLGNTDYFQFKNTSNWIEFTNIVLTYTITNQYTVTLNNQGADEGKGGTSSIAVTYGSNTNLSGTPAITKPIKTDKVFGGYYTNTNGTGTQIIDRFGNVIANASGGGKVYTDASGNWKYVGNITLYAYWGDLLTPAVTCTKTTLSVDEEVEDAFTFENTDEATWEISGTSIDSEINNGDGQVIEYDEDNNKLIAHNSGTARITFTQAKTAEINSGSFVFDITVNKHTPTFTWNTQDHYYYNSGVSPFVTKTSGGTYTVTSDNTEVVSTSGDNVTIYNKPGTASIRVLHPETYYWEEYDHSESITPEWKNNQLTLTVTEDNYTSVIEYHDAGSSDRFRWMNGGVLLGSSNVLTEAEGWDDRYIDIHFTGIPDSLSFTYERSVSTATGMDWWVKEKTEDGEWGNETIYHPSGNPADGSCKVALKPNTRWVRLNGSCNYGVYFRNIKITKKEYFKTDKSSLDFATNVKDASCDAQTFKFHHASAGYITTVSSSDSHFTVSPTSVTTGGEICDSAVITVSYSTAEVGEHSGTITISDNIGNSTSVSVAGTTVGAYTPTITWPGATSYLVGSTIANSFVAKDNNEDIISGTWSFESSDSTVIDVVEGELKAICGGTATITGTIAEGATWSSGSQTKTLTVTKPNDVITWDGSVLNDTLHVWADRDIAYSIASANTSATKKMTFTSRDATIVRVTSGETSDELRALKHGTTRLVAQTTADCSYSSVKDSIVVIVDPCDHYIEWNQKFMGLSTKSDFTIDTTITLTARAVDGTTAPTGKGITYTLEGDDLTNVSIVDSCKLRITGECDDIYVIASTSEDDKYEIATASRGIRVRRYGASCDSEVTDVMGDGEKHNVSGYTNKNGFTYDIAPSDTIFVKVGRESSITCDSIKFIGIESNSVETLIKGYNPSELKDGGEDKVILIDEKYRKLKIIARGETGIDPGPNGGTQYKWFSKLRIKQKSYLRSNKATITNDRVHVYDAINETVVVSYSDKPLLNYRITGSKLTLTPSETVNNDCGDYGSYTFTVSGVYTTTGVFKDTIYITTTALDTLRIPIEFTVSTGTSLYFQSGDGSWDSKTQWSNTSGVIQNQVPAHDNPVVIRDTVTISTEVEAYEVTIQEGGSIIIAPGGGLTIGAGGISGASTSNFFLKADSARASLTKGKTGYLRISPEYLGWMPQVTVEMYSVGYKDVLGGTNTEYWQYVGVPVDKADYAAKEAFPKSMVYSWQESTGKWINNRAKLYLQPFVGYATSQYRNSDGYLMTFTGRLVNNRGTKTVDLEYTDGERDLKGWNIVANSYTAPIDITKFKTTDFGAADATIHIWDARNKSFASIAISSLPDLPDDVQRVIPSMQAFFVQTDVETTMTFDYERLVWKGEEDNMPLKVKRNVQDSELLGRIRISLLDVEGKDELFLLEKEDYDRSYENGYDAPKKTNDEMAIIYAIEEERDLAVDATNSIIGTRIGVRTGEETAYTIQFSDLVGEEYALYDAETEEMIDITNENTYTFFAEPNSNITERFMIVEREGAPAVTTGNDKVTSDVRASKFIKDGQLFILKNGVLYDATGARVK